jgi:mRNA-degrading endonuclease HigB of HigAB toxin-antitoxin module
MKLISQLIILTLLAALGFWLWTVFFPSPEKIIRKEFASLATDVSFSPDENNLVKIAHAQSVAGFFTSNVVVNITIPGHEQQIIVGQDQINQAVIMSHQAVTSLKVRFPDVNVTVAPDKNSATADVTVDADVSGEKHAVIQEVKFSFQKIDRDWLIDRVDTVQVLSK